MTNVAAYLLGVVGGFVALTQLIRSLHFVAVALIIKVVRSVLTAWMLMFGMLQTRPSEPGN